MSVFENLTELKRRHEELFRRTLIVGASGLVGGELARLLRTEGYSITATYRSFPVEGAVPLTIADRSATRRLISALCPTLVLFPASITNVDLCEREPEKTRSENVAAVFDFLSGLDRGVPIVYFSSEYVFGRSGGPFVESDRVSPRNEYGRQKLEVERALASRAGSLVVRTVHVFGPEPRNKNFVSQLIAASRNGRTLQVPVDQVSTPTSVTQLARASLTLAAQGLEGVVHLAGLDRMSRFEFACRVASKFGLAADCIRPILTPADGVPRPMEAGLRSERVNYATLGITRLDEALEQERLRMMPGYVKPD